MMFKAINSWQVICCRLRFNTLGQALVPVACGGENSLNSPCSESFDEKTSELQEMLVLLRNEGPRILDWSQRTPFRESSQLSLH